MDLDYELIVKSVVDVAFIVDERMRLLSVINFDNMTEIQKSRFKNGMDLSDFFLGNEIQDILIRNLGRLFSGKTVSDTVHSISTQIGVCKFRIRYVSLPDNRAALLVYNLGQFQSSSELEKGEIKTPSYVNTEQLLFGYEQQQRELVEANRDIEKLSQLRNLVIEKDDIYYWEYDVVSDLFRNVEDLLVRVGLSPNRKMNSRDFFSLLSADTVEQVQNSFSLIMQSGQNIEVEAKSRSVINGQPRYEWFRYKGSVLRRDENGHPLHIIGTVLCIDDLKRRELELRNRQMLFDMAMDAGDMGVWVYNLSDGSFKNLHRQNTFAELDYKEVIKAMDPEAVQSNKKIFKEVIENRLRKKTIVVSLNLDGENHSFESYIGCVCDENNKPVRVIGTYKDITENIRERDELQEYQLRNRLVSAIGNIVSWQYDVAEKVFKFEINGSDTTDIPLHDKIYNDDWQLASSALDQLCQGSIQALNIKIRINYSDNTLQWCNVVGVVSKYRADGKPALIAGLSININREVLLREAAENASVMKSAFIANMSHEIRTPLNAIVGFSNLLADAETKEEKDMYVDIIRTNNDLLLNLINDILDLSRVESGKMEFSYGSTDLSLAIYDWLNNAEMAFKGTGIKVNIELPRTSCIINTDKLRLTQVITNFVNNARKFTRQGSLTIGYKSDEDIPGNVYIYVRDTGCGIAPDKLDAIFGRFVKLNDFVPGTGLGLSICESIVHTLGGKIGVKSELGKGSEFWVSLPLNVNV